MKIFNYLKKYISTVFHKIKCTNKYSYIIPVIVPPLFLYSCFKLFTSTMDHIIDRNVDVKIIFLVVILFLFFVVISLTLTASLKFKVFLSFFLTFFYYVGFYSQMIGYTTDLIIKTNEIRDYAIITRKWRHRGGCDYIYRIKDKEYINNDNMKGYGKKNIGDTIIIGYSAKYNYLSRIIELFPTSEQIEEVKRENMRGLSYDCQQPEEMQFEED